MERLVVGNYYHVICALVCVVGLVGWCDSQSHTKPSRNWPFCITKETLEEYKSEIPKGQEFIKDSLDESITRSRSNKQSYCLTCTSGSIEKVSIYRIITNKEFQKMSYLQNWFHIHIKTTYPVNAIVVQANAYPFQMAWGKFDVQFGCADCNMYSLLEDAKHSEKKTLELGGQAAAIPCRRRTYIHLRHPYVYVYASDTHSDQFHINYNYLDVTCRFADMHQFMMLTRVGNKVDYVKTAVVGLGRSIYKGGVSGMPYPFHADWFKDFTCHSELTHIIPVGNGHRAYLDYNADYDSCIVASKSVFAQQFRDDVSFVSNKVCKIPERMKCDLSALRYKIGSIESDHDGWRPHLCIPCNAHDNEFTREALRRLIRRSYLAKRVHGVSMIVGTIAFGVISIHISRYLKETGGGCLLVGWWLWAHLGLVIAGKAAIYIGLAMGFCQPERVPSEVDLDIEYKRKQMIAYHKVIGALPVILFHVDCIIGPWRPTSSSTRFILVLVHAVLGYVVILLALAAVIFSTACFDIVAYALIIVITSLAVWVIAMILQILSDTGGKLRPSRKYFPVIEAVIVPEKIPFKIVRLVLLKILIVVVVVCIVLMAIKGSYIGLIFRDPCSNCIWKYDEIIKQREDFSIYTSNVSTTIPMYSYFECEVKNGTWDKLIAIP